MPATEGLAQFGEIEAQDRVLDVGAGLAGPARWLMAHCGCEVVCVDLTSDFCEAARMLNAMSGYEPEIVCADVLKHDFPAAPFDVVWAQNSFMNFRDKAVLLARLNELLKPGGRLVAQELMAGSGDQAFAYPVPWASGPEQNFLVSPDEYRGLLESSGFVVRAWEDKTEWWHALSPPTTGPGLGDWVAGWSEKSKNTGENAAADLIVLWWIVAAKPAGG